MRIGHRRPGAGDGEGAGAGFGILARPRAAAAAAISGGQQAASASLAEQAGRRPVPRLFAAPAGAALEYQREELTHTGVTSCLRLSSTRPSGSHGWPATKSGRNGNGPIISAHAMGCGIGHETCPPRVVD